MADFVLVHGAWHGAWCWTKVVPLLEAAGHRAYTPTLAGLGEKAAALGPEIGLGTHVQDVVGVIESNGLHEVVLAGHSYSGMSSRASPTAFPSASGTWSTWMP